MRLECLFSYNFGLSACSTLSDFVLSIIIIKNKINFQVIEENEKYKLKSKIEKKKKKLEANRITQGFWNCLREENKR